MPCVFTILGLPETKGTIRIMKNKEEKNEHSRSLTDIFKKSEGHLPSSRDALRYDPDPDMGLSSAQVEKRTAEGYVNASVDKCSKTVSQIVLSNVFTYFNTIFFVLAFILLIEKSYNNLTFLLVVFVNTIIGIIQEIRAKNTLEKLTLVSAPLVKVIRDGADDLVASEELVLDDIIVLSAGNQIPADAFVCDGEVSVNEALVTGESDEIKKKAGDALLSGSFIISGSCRARLDKVGHESFASKLTLDAKKIKKKQQPGMMKSLTLLIKIIGIIIIPLSIIMFINQYSSLSVKENIENTTASIIGMIPEGLYLLTTVALAVSVMRLAKKRTLVHDMKCIETLARVDVICVDKTGTITEPDMHLKDIVPLGDEDETDYYDAERMVRDLVLNMSADNDTMRALQAFFDDKREFRRAEEIQGFSSKTKYSAVRFREGAYILGAPEFILKSDYDSVRPQIEEHSSAGERVLLFAEYQYRRGSSFDIFEGGELGGIVIPTALVTLENRVREEAAETFSYFTDQGVKIKVISGDNPLTASKAAQAAGIPDADKYIDASLLTTKEKLSNAVLEYTVFGRVTPEQKRMFIKALKKAGHTVAMTGDGVNDVLALKDADCSIAMASGSDAAASVSDLVLLDSDFSSMPAVVAEGRRVINNIERSASLFLVKNIFSFILTIITIVSTFFYPLKPAQLSLVSAVMIGIPSFFLALEPNRERVKGKFLRNVLFRAAPAAITAVILVGWSLLFVHAFNIPKEAASSVAFYLYSAIAYMMLFKVCKPMNLLHKLLFGSMGVLYMLAVILVPSWFSLYPLNFGAVLVLFTLMVIGVPLDLLMERAFLKFTDFKRKAKEYIERDVESYGRKKG